MHDYMRICCAWCGSECVYHGRITIHTSGREDADGTSISVYDGDVDSTPAARSEFLGRRDDVVIGLWCENCGKKSRIEIMQHKGMTLWSVARRQ